MASKRKQSGQMGDTGRNAAQRRAPEWADGLKQLYDSVVEEDLPDSFKDLLDQLDGLGSGQAGNQGAAPSPDGRGADQ